MDKQTHRPSTVTLAAHARRGLMKGTEVYNPIRCWHAVTLIVVFNGSAVPIDLIGRAGASPPSRTAAIIFLYIYIYIYIYLYIYIRPTVLAPGWPRATRKRSRPDHTCKYMYTLCIRIQAYCESNNASHGNDKRGYREATETPREATEAPRRPRRSPLSPTKATEIIAKTALQIPAF